MGKSQYLTLLSDIVDKKELVMEHDLPNCWEIRKCGRERGGKDVSQYGECPVSEMGMGHSCWVVAGSFHDGEPYCPQVKNEGTKCTQCEVFKLYCRSVCSKGMEISEAFPEEERMYQKLMSEKHK